MAPGRLGCSACRIDVPAGADRCPRCLKKSTVRVAGDGGPAPGAPASGGPPGDGALGELRSWPPRLRGLVVVLGALGLAGFNALLITQWQRFLVVTLVLTP